MRKGRVLVLNFDFSPITVCTVQRAFLLVYLQKAEMLAGLNGNVLRSVTQSFPMPAVIRLGRYINVPYKGVMLSRQNVFRRDGFQCQYCGSSKDLTLDHVVPRSRNGKSNWTNLVTACKRCNTRKGNYTPEMAGMKLRRQPEKPSYLHFLRDHSGLMMAEWIPYLELKKTG
ncbi:HNH endonuclease [Flammeovirgaceae bacterium 311]|nr:HNH endonuclease [Flammeovirgaceae bacterium 311]